MSGKRWTTTAIVAINISQTSGPLVYIVIQNIGRLWPKLSVWYCNIRNICLLRVLNTKVPLI